MDWPKLIHCVILLLLTGISFSALQVWLKSFKAKVEAHLKCQAWVVINKVDPTGIENDSAIFEGAELQKQMNELRLQVVNMEEKILKNEQLIAELSERLSEQSKFIHLALTRHTQSTIVFNTSGDVNIGNLTGGDQISTSQTTNIERK